MISGNSSTKSGDGSEVEQPLQYGEFIGSSSQAQLFWLRPRLLRESRKPLLYRRCPKNAGEEALRCSLRGLWT